MARVRGSASHAIAGSSHRKPDLHTNVVADPEGQQQVLSIEEVAAHPHHNLYTW